MHILTPPHAPTHPHTYPTTLHSTPSHPHTLTPSPTHLSPHSPHTLTGPPTITSINPGQVHMSSSGATSPLRCQVNESSTLVAIYHDNVPLETTPVSISNGGGAEIEISSRSDSGWYTCTATNSVGRIDVDFLIIFGGECSSAATLAA